jgi:hypothetical protein
MILILSNGYFRAVSKLTSWTMKFYKYDEKFLKQSNAQSIKREDKRRGRAKWKMENIKRRKAERLEGRNREI